MSEMSKGTAEIDILIVGAGPVGLFLANECARRGLRYRLIEARPAQSIYSKALAIFPRTLEIFDMAGVVQPFLKAANKVTEVSVTNNGKTLAHMHFAPEESPYPFIAMVPQDVTEKLLVEELQRKGGNVEYETTFATAREREGLITATVNRGGATEEIRARFVVGCDGAHSAVRHLLNLKFEGAEYEDSFMLADVESNELLRADEMQLCPHEAGPLAIFPMSATRRRLVAMVAKEQDEAPSLEMVQKLLRERGPVGFEAYAVHWSSYFRIHHRHVGQLRVGRIFVAGDAAHIHSPFGGQGMNTGLQDAWNLVWKLDLFLRGRGNERLLESYTAERIPVIKGVIDTTHNLTRAMGTPNKLAQTLRNALIPMVSRLASFQHAFVQRMSELGIAYEGSPIVEGPGKRFWNKSLQGGDGILHRFLVITNKDATGQTKDEVRKLVESFSDVVEMRMGDEEGVALVRPDGYTAYKNSGVQQGDVEAMREILVRQTEVQ